TTRTLVLNSINSPLTRMPFKLPHAITSGASTFDRAAGLMVVIEITFGPAQPQIIESVKKQNNSQRIKAAFSVRLFLFAEKFFRDEIIFGSRIF
ncbi:hypothetical protein DWB58_05555, partial [candidate division KSB1 bacterium]|nr:hypothetical protein [candidate division KSB1 bacterium]